MVSGVPQGTILSPLLFFLYINDLPSVVSSKVRLFSDDCLIYRNIKNKEDQIALQKQLCLLSWLDYGSQLWLPFLFKHITQLEKIQWSFTKYITGMNDMPYHERLKSLGLYSLQKRREIKITFLDVEAGHASFPMSM